ncbi:hypothetical protein ACIA03_18330 [Nocardioides sp. NPDC051685]|uniref:hypothetical protein n=1 Tax=Nocardioides sp. NPDC051685 TaxID=3364334 RepID=UPI0037B36716
MSDAVDDPDTERNRVHAAGLLASQLRAVLYAEPAFLCLTSVEQPKGRDLGDPIHVAIQRSRRVRPQDGLVIHRLADLAPRTYGGTPPRLNFEDNALLMAHEARRDIDAIAAFAQVASRSYVTADSLRGALARYPSLRRRSLIAAMIDDLEAGTHSVLEHGYLTKVERPHGLPTGKRQVQRAAPNGNQFRDVEYVAYGLVVELDGALGHESWRDQGRDADRDLDDLARVGSVTARLRWHQVFDTPCRTAARIGKILVRGGWQGAVQRCRDGCDLTRV